MRLHATLTTTCDANARNAGKANAKDDTKNEHADGDASVIANECEELGVVGVCDAELNVAVAVERDALPDRRETDAKLGEGVGVVKLGAVEGAGDDRHDGHGGALLAVDDPVRLGKVEVLREVAIDLTAKLGNGGVDEAVHPVVAAHAAHRFDAEVLLLEAVAKEEDRREVALLFEARRGIQRGRGAVERRDRLVHVDVGRRRVVRHFVSLVLRKVENLNEKRVVFKVLEARQAQ